MQISTIGILGGMGPEASNKLCSLITALTEVARDQDHIPVIAYNNSAIPSRAEAILHGGTSPVPELVRTAQVLENAGADFIVIPCNSAHLFYHDIQRAVSIPVLHMISETADHVRHIFPNGIRLGVIATDAALDARLYNRHLSSANYTLVHPSQADQLQVMSAIFGPAGLKCGFTEEPRQILGEIARKLLANGAEAILSGCTEVSLVLDSSSPFHVIDPLEVMARVAIAKARCGFGRKQASVSTGAQLLQWRPSALAQK